MATIKDVTIRFNTDTKQLLESEKLFDKVNDKIKEQNGAINQLKQKEQELIKLRAQSNDPKQIDIYNKELQQTYEQQKKLTAVTKDTANQMGKFNDTLLQIGSSLGIAFGVQEVINFGKECVKAFMEAEVNAKKLEFAVRNIAGGSNSAFNKLIEQSSKLQELSIFSDDSIQQAQTALVQFGLTTDQVEKLTPMIIDLASATGEDLASATGRVINGINGQTKSLKDVGIAFEDTGSKTENLTLLFDKLDKFAGATGNTLETNSGKIQRLQNIIGDKMELIGAKIFDAGNSLVDFYGKWGEADVKQKGVQYLNALTLGLFNLKSQAQQAKEAQDKVLQAFSGVVNAGVGDTKIQDDLTLKGQQDAEKKKEEDEKKRIEREKKNEAIRLKLLEDRLKKERELRELISKDIDDNQKDSVKTEEDTQKALEKLGRSAIDYRKGQAKEADKLIKKSAEQKDKEAEAEEKRTSAILEAEKIKKDTQLQLASELVGGIADLLSKDEENRKQYGEALKLLALAEIGINLARELQAISVAATLSTQNVASGGIYASVVVPVQQALAIARAGFAVAQVAQAKFHDGGYTGDGNEWTEAGIVHKGEYVMPADKTKEHKSLLEAMHKDNLEKHLQDKYIRPQLELAMDKIGFKHSIYESLKMNGGLDEYGMSRALRKGTIIRNVDELADAVSRKTSTSELKLLKKRGII